MDWKQRNFHCEGYKKSQEEPRSRSSETWHLPALDRSLNSAEVEGSSFRIQPQNRRQHEHGRDHRIQKEFDRRIHSPAMSIHADEQGHRNQRRFPEEVKLEKIQGNEYPDQRRFQDQQQNKKFLHPISNRIPRDQNT